MNRTLITIAGLIFFILTGIYMERSDYFAPARVILQDRSIPSPVLNFGKTGQIMKNMGLKFVVPSESEAPPLEDIPGSNLKSAVRIDHGRLTFRDNWAGYGKLSQENMPSSTVMDQKAISEGIPILSVVINEFDLYDPATGIFENNTRKGRSWEKPCFVSYFDEGRLLFATGAGVRVHGGKKGSAMRLYFRKIYGDGQFKPGILFDEKSDPLQHLVVHDESRGGFHYLNVLAYDISEQIGCLVPHSRPVKVFLNGSVHGQVNYALIEHLSREYLVSHFGHDDFIYFRSKGRKPRPGAYRELMQWAGDTDRAMTLEQAGKRVNIDNLSRWWLAQIFCANTDIYQGMALLDNSRPDATWFWINWDMDHSFRNKYEHEIENIWEQKRAIHELMHDTTIDDPRAVVFKRLIEEDPAYRAYLEKLFMDVLNHRLTWKFFDTRTDYYEKAAMDFGVKDTDYVNRIRLFLENRHEFMRSLIREYFQFPESYICSVIGPKDIVYTIDGYIAEPGYGGWYFKGAKISVEIAGGRERETVYWLLNGETSAYKGRKLAFEVKEDTVIEPMFEEVTEKEIAESDIL